MCRRLPSTVRFCAWNRSWRCRSSSATTGLRLTAAGELLLHAANNWKKDFTRVCEQLDDLRGLRRGHVRIATIDAINRHFFDDAQRGA